MQRIELPHDAIISVQMRDVPLQAVPAIVIAEVEIPAEGKQVPIPFHIPYTPEDINVVRTYAVRARWPARNNS